MDVPYFDSQIEHQGFSLSLPPPPLNFILRATVKSCDPPENHFGGGKAAVE